MKFSYQCDFISVTLQLIADQNPYVIGIRDTESVQVGHNLYLTYNKFEILREVKKSSVLVHALN